MIGMRIINNNKLRGNCCVRKTHPHGLHDNKMSTYIKFIRNLLNF